MPQERADSLDLPMMVSRDTDPLGTAFTVSVDVSTAGTGISASDRDGDGPGSGRRPRRIREICGAPGMSFPCAAGREAFWSELATLRQRLTLLPSRAEGPSR